MTNTTKKPQVLLMILDGWGYREENKYNAINNANPEYMNHLWETYPHALFEASGEAVGLPPGTIGTSEIGHLTIGAGRIIYTDIMRVNKAVKENTLKDNEALNALIDHVKKHKSTLHVMGLVSPGGVHSHQDHLYAFLRLAKEKNIERVVVHVFADGRDTPPQSAVKFVSELETVLDEVGNAIIGTINGRYYAMDRDKNWERTQKAYDCLFEGKGEQHTDKKASDIIKALYTKDLTDEFLPPQVLLQPDGKTASIQQNDGIFFYNFRPDRARQMTKMVLDVKEKMNLFFVTLTEYDKTLPSTVAFPQLDITNTLSDIFAKHTITQAHIAETEKYAHVTYFFNGGKEIKHENEEFVMIPSRKDVPTHDLAPEMKAAEIAEKTIEYIEKGTEFIVINFANADMVGHTGKYDPAVVAVKAEDEAIKRVTEAMLAKGGVVLITADHGNAEEMYDEKNNHPITAHSMNPVPFIITDKNVQILDRGTLADVAPTILHMYGIQIPAEMTGKNMIK